VTQLANFAAGVTVDASVSEHALWVAATRLEIVAGLEHAADLGCEADLRQVQTAGGHRRRRLKVGRAASVKTSVLFEHDVVAPAAVRADVRRRLAASGAGGADNKAEDFCNEGYWKSHTDIFLPMRDEETNDGAYFDLSYSHSFTCDKSTKTFNEMSMLWLNGGIKGIKILLMRGVPRLVGIDTCLIFGVVYFCLAAITAGISVPAGLVVPMLLIGGSLGRATGLILLVRRRARRSLCNVKCMHMFAICLLCLLCLHVLLSFVLRVWAI
jgi:hypothetical protein